VLKQRRQSAGNNSSLTVLQPLNSWSANTCARRVSLACPLAEPSQIQLDSASTRGLVSSSNSLYTNSVLDRQKSSILLINKWKHFSILDGRPHPTRQLPGVTDLRRQCPEISYEGLVNLRCGVCLLRYDLLRHWNRRYRTTWGKMVQNQSTVRIGTTRHSEAVCAQTFSASFDGIR
jgi:hypothetical protein